MNRQALETDQSPAANRAALNATSPLRKESLIARLARRGELAPAGDPELNTALFEASARFREHWLRRECSDYHDSEYAAARDALSSYRKDVLRTVEAAALAELSLEMMGTETIPGKNPARRKKVLIAHLHLGLRELATHFSTRPLQPD